MIQSANYRSATSGVETTFVNLGGLQLVGTCAAGDLAVIARTTVTNSTIGGAAFNTVTADTIANEFNDSSFDVGDNVNVLPNDDDAVNGQVEFQSTTGQSVSVNYRAEDDGPSAECEFTGTASLNG